jgi:GNAT superfamily N-acetyltransferase
MLGSALPRDQPAAAEQSRSMNARTSDEPRVVPVAAEHAPGLVALFERNAVSCYCQYWHFHGDKNAWLDRCAHAPERNKSELEDGLARGAEAMRGVVATDPLGTVVGWMKLAPASTVGKIYDQRVYRKLPCFGGDRRGVYAIGCFLVDEAWRRRGVARALVSAGVGAARAWGAMAIECFPRRSATATAGELWTGPLEALLAAGFAVVHDFEPYPVLRLNLARAAGPETR